MPSQLLTSTIQAAILSAISNILAQLMTAYQNPNLQSSKRATTNSNNNNNPLEQLGLSLTPILHFILFTLLNCPPNVLWQEFLEQRFPGQQTTQQQPQQRKTAGGGGDVVVVGKEEKKKETHQQQQQQQQQQPKLDVRNTMIKLLLDQTVAAAINTIAFSAIMAGLRGADTGAVLDAVRKDFWPVTKAGWKLWPLVSLVNFTMVPVEKRVVVGSLVGVGWGVYLSLMAGS